MLFSIATTNMSLSDFNIKRIVYSKRIFYGYGA